MTWAPAGTSTLAPTAAILPSLITKVPSSIGEPASVTILACVIAKTETVCCATHRGATHTKNMTATRQMNFRDIESLPTEALFTVHRRRESRPSLLHRRAQPHLKVASACHLGF